MDRFLLSFFISFCFLTSNLKAQQRYSGNSVLDCNNNDETGPSPAVLYSCNGEKPSCQTFLIFRSQSPYNSVSTISNLTSSDPLELAHINNISSFNLLPPDKEVIVPVNCSCSGRQYYQANTSYVIPSIYDTYFTIANYTYQGLSTCDSLIRENVYDALNLIPRLKLRVPLRCACPTRNQIANGTKFLLTYLVSWGDSIPNVSERFNVSRMSVAYANGFSEDNPTLFPFTTILLPLPTEPSSSQTIIHHPPVVSHQLSPHLSKRRSKKGLYVGIGTGSSLAVLCFALYVLFLHHREKKTDESAWKDREGKEKWELPEHLQVGIACVDQVLKVYEFEELKAATENFSPKNRVSDCVYRGVLGGEVLAIKRMSTGVSKEAYKLKKINHFSLISLYGACEHHGIFYLVYEYMENGSLSDWLRRKSCPEVQSWNHRIQIALDVANGLHYLHSFTYPAYLHKDINSSNVLLNRDLRAKIANFSLARSAVKGENGNSSTNCAVGLKGYMAPEYLEAGLVTPEIDIYAFGVVLLELITGKEAAFKQDGKEVLLSEAIFSTMDGGNAEAELGYLIDPSLQVKPRMELALRIVKLSVACLAREPASRLSMAKVVSTLLRIQLDAQKSESLSRE